MHSPSTPSQPVSSRSRLAWGLLLVLFYLLVAPVGWRRPFITTEAWALYFAGQPLSAQIAAIRNDLVHPPLMYMLERGWFAVFGHTDAAAHALPVAVGIPAIFLLTLLATRVTSRWRLLAFYLACLYLPVGGSASLARMYGLALLLTTAAILLWDAWRTNPRPLLLAAWTAVVTLLLYTHLFGALIIAAFVVLNWLQGPRKWTFTFAAAVPALAFLPWFLYVLPVFESRGLEENLNWVHENLFSALPSLLANFLGAFNTTDRRARLLLAGLAAVIHVALLILLWRNRAHFRLPGRDAGASPPTEEERARRWFWSAMVLAGVPVAGLLAFSLIVNSAFEARFILGAAIPYSIAIFLLCQLSGRAGMIMLLGVLLPWRAGVVLNSVRFHWTPGFPREAIEYVATQARSGDLLLVDRLGYGGVVYWEWNRRLHRTEPMAVLPPAPDEPSLMAVIEPRSVEQLELSAIRRIWVFQSEQAPQPGLSEALAARGFFPVAPAQGGKPGATGVPKLFLFERSSPD